MDVGHDADAAAPGKFMVTHPLDLLDGFIFDGFSETDRRIHFSLNFQHFFFLQYEKNRLPCKTSGENNSALYAYTAAFAVGPVLSEVHQKINPVLWIAREQFAALIFQHNSTKHGFFSFLRSDALNFCFHYSTRSLFCH